MNTGSKPLERSLLNFKIYGQRYGSDYLRFQDAIDKPIGAIGEGLRSFQYTWYHDIFLLMHAAIKQGKPLTDLLTFKDQTRVITPELALSRVQYLIGGRDIAQFFYKCLRNDQQALEILNRVVERTYNDTVDLRYACLKDSLQRNNQNISTFLLNRELTGKPSLDRNKLVYRLPLQQ